MDSKYCDLPSKQNFCIPQSSVKKDIFKYFATPKLTHFPYFHSQHKNTHIPENVSTNSDRQLCEPGRIA